jgi:alkanesulfonate monooxygenase SsuD/methylene tetrahydromethanopterin reductase-like flavin-dependent oxidoreductase (luciferase family)
MTELGAIPLFKNRPDMADSEVTAAYLADTNWFIGSPETVARKLEKLHHDTGGFGVVLQLAMDYSLDRSEAWRRSMQLLAEEVMPRLRHLN